MKKTLFTLVALVGIVQADETPTYIVQDGNFSYYPQLEPDDKIDNTRLDLSDIVNTFNTGTFAISFDLSSVLATDNEQNSFDFHFGYGAEGASSYLAFAYAPNPAPGILPGNYLLTHPNVVDLFSATGLENAISAERLIVQVDDLFGSSPTVTLLGYTEGKELETFWSVAVPGNPPDSIENASLSLHGIGENITPTEGLGLTIWQGKVTADDMANPTPAPAPSPNIPEPATATLSLLALAGLAARRRRASR